MTEPEVVLVEDSVSDEKLAILALRASGVSHRVVVCRDGAEALDHLLPEPGAEPPRELPRLVLLDLKLPKVDGLEVLRRLRADARTFALPIVVLSASREDVDVSRCHDLGANAYVRKPVEFAEFKAAAKVIAEFWLRLNEWPPLGPDRQ